jgi:uncharacterized protein (UPF0297 family)
MDEFTKKFTPVQTGANTREVVAAVYAALLEKGYNPVNQIVGYILSEDPTYITNHKNARNMICKLDRDELLSDMVMKYVKAD